MRFFKFENISAKNLKNEFDSKCSHELLSDAEKTNDPKVIAALISQQLKKSNIDVKPLAVHLLLDNDTKDAFVQNVKTIIIKKYPNMKDHIFHLKKVINGNDFNEIKNVIHCYLKVLELYDYVCEKLNKSNFKHKNICSDFLRLIKFLLIRGDEEKLCWTTPIIFTRIDSSMVSGIAKLRGELFHLYENLQKYWDNNSTDDKYSKKIRDVIYQSPSLYGEESLKSACRAFAAFLIEDARLENTPGKRLAERHYSDFSELLKSYSTGVKPDPSFT